MCFGARFMRLVVVAAALALAGCDAPEGAIQAASSDAASSAMQGEAEKACAAMTGFGPGALHGLTEQTQAMLKREYEACVTQVAHGDPPALRGRTEAP